MTERYSQPERYFQPDQPFGVPVTDPPPSVERFSGREQRERTDNAVLRAIAKLDIDAGPINDDQPTTLHYVRGHFGILAFSRGLRTVSVRPLTLPEVGDSGDDELIFPTEPLPPGDIDLLEQAILEHDRLTTEQRRELGMEDPETGESFAADTAYLMKYLDHEDERVDYDLDEAFQTECTYSCKSTAVMHPNHRRKVLTRRDPDNKKEHIPYDPPGTSPREKELRDEWRKQQIDFKEKINRDHATAGSARARFMREAAGEISRFGEGHKGTGEVDPRYVELRRDERRALMGVPLQGDPDKRAMLEMAYVAGMKVLFKKYKLVPPTTQELLGPAARRPALEPESKGRVRALLSAILPAKGPDTDEHTEQDQEHEFSSQFEPERIDTHKELEPAPVEITEDQEEKPKPIIVSNDKQFIPDEIDLTDLDTALSEGIATKIQERFARYVREADGYEPDLGEVRALADRLRDQVPQAHTKRHGK